MKTKTFEPHYYHMDQVVRNTDEDEVKAVWVLPGTKLWKQWAKTFNYLTQMENKLNKRMDLETGAMFVREYVQLYPQGPIESIFFTDLYAYDWKSKKFIMVYSKPNPVYTY